MSESNLVVLPDMQAVENTEPEEIKAQEGIVSAASKKLDEEEKAFVGSGRAKMIFPHVVKTLRGFIEEDDRFAEVFANTVRTVSECCAAVVDKSGDVMSDLEVYRKAVQFYFPTMSVSRPRRVTSCSCGRRTSRTVRGTRWKSNPAARFGRSARIPTSSIPICKRPFRS